ncbi:hypothetical protein [Cohnella nanjingensis]|uniref:Uncharacterized protein n=1 Tax=Cohnella nanjingensis TaxID=1387779 RepID=A0A7X0RQK9_9BACL|nr:hypothetical protein [Cohnella nanjingensis]MBB6671653.1 hypothetical protein [Cohnella nanjingensis]
MNEYGGERKRVAAIVTEYRHNSHAEMIVGRLLGDFGYHPRVEVATIYTDQVPEGDLSRAAAAEHGIPICATIGDAVLAPHAGGPVDGVILIGEHGDYPVNEKGQMLYPRRRFLEETLAALDRAGRTVPIFSDKHLSWHFSDARWMYDQLKKRGIPFLGGSSIPHADPIPAYDPEVLCGVKDIFVVSSGGLEAYGFHAADVLQSLAERRKGGETGIRSVRLMGGAEMAVPIGRHGEAWAAMDRGEWPEELLLAALRAFPGLPLVHPRTAEPDPALFVYEYANGTTGYVLQFQRLIEQWGFACRDRRGHVTASRLDSGLERPFGHFERLTRFIERLILTGRPPFPMERTLLSTGMINLAMESLHAGRKLETPELAIAYARAEADLDATGEVDE